MATPSMRDVPIAAELAQSSWTWAPVASACVAAAVAIAVLFANQAASRRDRRRELYADAYRAALGLVEMVYRTRRAGPDNLRATADHFHQLHEEINFHQGWIETESKYMGRAYRRLVLSVRAATEDALVEAWAALRSAVLEAQATWPQISVEGDHPDVSAAKSQFLQDVADHLAWTRSDRLQERYGDREWRVIRATLPQATGGTFFDPPPDGESPSDAAMSRR